MKPSARPGGWLLLVSRNAGGADPEAVTAARDVLAAAGPVELVETATEDELEAALDRRGERVPVVAGGDGSLSLVVRRMRARKELERTPLALVPLGTGNDFARALGVPLEPAEAARAAITGVAHQLDLLLDDGYGVTVNAAHLGVGAEAARAAAGLKGRLGLLAYPLGALRVGASNPGWPLYVEVSGERQPVVLADGRRKLLMVAIGNGSGTGGGTPVLPSAEPDDGLLDVAVVSATGPLARVGFGAALSRGTHLDRPDVRTARSRTVTVVSLDRSSVGLNTDGEVSDVVRRTWWVDPGAWALLRCM